MPIEYYRLERVVIPDPKPGKRRIVNAAVFSCQLCNKTISGHGGPSEEICIECGDLLKKGELKGAVIYEDKK